MGNQLAAHSATHKQIDELQNACVEAPLGTLPPFRYRWRRWSGRRWGSSASDDAVQTRRRQARGKGV